MDFLETNQIRSSKFIPEERNMRSWWKHNNYLLNSDEIKVNRVALFENLMETGKEYRRVNQYK